MLSLSLRHSTRVFSPVSSLSPSLFCAPAPSSSSSSLPFSSSLLPHNSFTKKPFQTNSQREERDHPRFDFHGGDVNRSNFTLHQQIHDLTERVEELTEENQQLQEKIRSYNPSKYGTRPGSVYGNSSHLNWFRGLKRNGPLNLFYIHHPLTNEIPLDEKKTDTHVAAWSTLGLLTALQFAILMSWGYYGGSYDEEVQKMKESELTDEEKDETLEGIKGAVEGITFMEDNFMTSTSNLNKHGRWWTLLTSCFSHSDFYHFLGNMVAMWLFGFKLLRVIGPARFMALYSAGGIFSSLCQNGFSSWSGGTEELPPFAERCQSSFDWEKLNDPKWDVPCLGASGSVLALAGAAALFFPKDMVIVRFVPFPLPFPIAASIYLVSDLLGLTHPDFLKRLTEGEDLEENYRPNVGHAAHVGGIVFGFLFSMLLSRGRKVSFSHPHKSVVPRQ